MRKTAIFGNVTSISMSEEIQYIYWSLIVSQINLINIKWIRPFKIDRLPTKFLSMYTFAKIGPGNVEHLEETDQLFPNTSEK